MTAKVTYTGELRTMAVHVRSGSEIETDAPVDNHGKGERFSPTDLMATSLAACMLTTIAILGERHEIDITGATCDVEKIMAASPRRIGEIKIKFHWAAGSSYDEKQRERIEAYARTCPVMETMHPDCIKTVDFNWPSA